MASQTPHRSAVYNILLPIWLLVWFPSLLWLGLIPANYLIDLVVLRFGLQRMAPESIGILKQASWRVCWRGFVADFVGAAFLFVALLVFDAGDALSPSFSEAGYALGMNPFLHPLSLLLVCVSIALAGFVIYLLDRRLLAKHFSLAETQAHQVALLLALVTAPYLFLVPSTLLYP